MIFARWRKKPVEVLARKMSRPFTVETPEGTMKGEKGDYLVIGVEDERYPVKAEIFKKTHEKV